MAQVNEHAGSKSLQLVGNAEVVIRPLRREDVPEVVTIERDGQPSPWSDKQFIDEIEKIAAAQPMVAEVQSQIIGFLAIWFVVDEIFLNNIGVAVHARRKGIASTLLDWLFEIGRQKNCASIQLEVRESNAAAIALYEKAGFERCGLRKRYYSDTGEDAILMHYLFEPA